MDVDPYVGKVDLRNYGEPLGIEEARRLGSDLLSAPYENIITGEQSSLLLTYQMMLAHYLLPVLLHGRIKTIQRLFVQFQDLIGTLECWRILVLACSQSL